MADPLKTYLTRLQERDAHEKAQKDLIDDYTKLADAYAHAQKANRERAPPSEEDAKQQQQQPTSRIPPSITGSKPASPQPSSSDSPSQLRRDLTVANRTVHDLHNQIAALKDEVESLKRSQSLQETEKDKLNQRILKLEADRTTLTRRVRDRDGELKEKNRIVAHVQDEMVSIEMQMNVAEERAKKLEAENEDLVKRYMRRVGTEAEEMNEGSGWK